MRVADRRLWAVQQALGRTVVVKSRSPSLFHSSHFNWEPAEGLEMFRYVSSILSSLPAEFILLTYGFGKASSAFGLCESLLYLN